MKIGILFKFKDGPWGGGNQFLKALRYEWEQSDVYTDELDQVDAVLINSHHDLPGIAHFKSKHPAIPVIHRIDGPVDAIRGTNTNVDKTIYDINERIADATIFQSEWSKYRNRERGIGTNKFETTIINAPNPNIFFAKDKKVEKGRKIKIIASSWANNKNKGFDTYLWLDENLDFSKYEMTFVGNTPVPFKNIEHISAVSSEELAELLREHDIYITASKKDPCSNALLEALHCGLPAIARRDGGHPEIVGKAGELFDTKEQIPQLLDTVASNLMTYRSHIKPLSLPEVAERYRSFVEGVVWEVKRSKYQPKKLSWLNSKKISCYHNGRILFFAVRRKALNFFRH